MNLELFYPLKGAFISQPFGGNANTSYKTDGLMGHPAVDLVSSYDDPIYLVQDGFIYKVVNKDNPDFSKFRGIFQIAEGFNGITNVTEILYGHCNKMDCPHGKADAGDIVGTEGNTGEVFVGGIAITKEEREQGSKAGAHLHLQCRAVQRTVSFDPTKHFITSEEDATKPYQDSEGYFYLVPNYDNGFNGCFDPQPFFNGHFAGEIPIQKKIIMILKNVVALLTNFRKT